MVIVQLFNFLVLGLVLKTRVAFHHPHHRVLEEILALTVKMLTHRPFCAGSCYRSSDDHGASILERETGKLFRALL